MKATVRIEVDVNDGDYEVKTFHDVDQNYIPRLKELMFKFVGRHKLEKEECIEALSAEEKEELANILNINLDEEAVLGYRDLFPSGQQGNDQPHTLHAVYAAYGEYNILYSGQV